MLVRCWKATKPEQQSITDITSATMWMEKIKLGLEVGNIARRIHNAKNTGGRDCLPSLATSHQSGVGNGREGTQCEGGSWQDQGAVLIGNTVG